MTRIEPSALSPTMLENSAIQHSLFEIFELCAPVISSCLRNFPSELPDSDADEASTWSASAPKISPVRQVS